jgi:hypothetical protein
LKLARFLASVRTRARTPIPEDLDPIGLILTRVGVHPHTVESKALRKATFAVIATEGDMAETDLWALGADALGLLDAFALQQLTDRYSAPELEVYANRMRGVHRVPLTR